MGSVSGTGSASRDRYSENTWENSLQQFLSNTNQNRTGNRRAAFEGPQAESTLGYLTDQVGQGGGYQQQAGQAYGDLARLRGQPNPEVENIIKSSNQEAETAFQNRLGQSRAAGYRGGTGANLYNQDKVAAEFSNKQAGENAALRYGAFNDAQNRGLSGQVAGAGGLAGLSGQSGGLAAQLLALLRGENVEDISQSSTTGQQSNAATGGKSGKRSSTGQEISASYQYT
jgi:hypothetical protein